MKKLVTNKPLVIDKQLAVIFGLKEAIILQQINYWLEINKSKNNNYREGRYWTYNTLNKWQEEFPFWSLETVKRTFRKLRNKNLLITNNFNKMKTDRTLWYTINHEELDRIINEYKLNNKMIKRNESDNKNGLAYNETMDMKENDTMLKKENESIDKSIMKPPIPEITADISTDITTNNSNQSFNQIDKGIRKERRTEDKKTKYNFLDKYRQVIDKCEIDHIDINYRGAIKQAIMFLLLETNNGGKVKIGNNYIPGEKVRSDIDKLDASVIEHAIGIFKEASNSKKIKGEISYLKTCIYTSLTESKLDKDFKFSYDGSKKMKN